MGTFEIRQRIRKGLVEMKSYEAMRELGALELEQVAGGFRTEPAACKDLPGTGWVHLNFGTVLPGGGFSGPACVKTDSNGNVTQAVPDWEDLGP